MITTRKFRLELAGFREFGAPTLCSEVVAGGEMVPSYTNEFWTAKQRAASNLHEVPYRACFKPQLPRFFIERFTDKGELVYDPFMGRGTTLVEAALLGRNVAGCDINPLSQTLVAPRLSPPTHAEVLQRLESLDLSQVYEPEDDLLVFYHPDTLRQIQSLRSYLMGRELDAVDSWIRMVALTRLTGHSAGYFSVYSLPPNQAVLPIHQRRINAKRNQVPDARDVKALIAKKSNQLSKELTPAQWTALRNTQSTLMTGSAGHTPALADASISLVVTSPPFLDVVNYKSDNWLRCWFLGIDASEVAITQLKKLPAWQTVMTEVFHELFRVLKPGGLVAFEVGEVSAGKIRLEEAIIPCGISAGLRPSLVLINAQEFTKTANCWGVDNNAKGTNTNRIVIFEKGK
jgi:hypothetical protein